MTDNVLPPGHFEPLTGRAGAERFSQLVAVEQAKLDGVRQEQSGNVAAFDADMREKGLQRTDAPATGEPDARAVEFLQQWRRDNPNPTPQQRALWEKDLTEVLQGRRLNETPQQFEARQRGESNAGAAAEQPSEPAAALPPAVAAVVPAGAELDAPEAMTAVLETAKGIGVSAETLGAILSEAAQTIDAPSGLPDQYTDQPFSIFDYEISPQEIGEGYEGFMLDRNSRELYAVCRAARERGIGQAQLIQMMKSYFAG